jgi:DNA polymerase IV
VTAARMERLGIRTGLDLRGWTLERLAAEFGRAGAQYHGMARGEDHRPVEAERVRKSLGAETTFGRDLLRWDEVTPAMAPLFGKLWAACEADGLRGRTVTVKLKYADFRQITRSRSVAEPVAGRDALEHLGLDLLRPHFPPPRGVRLLGVALSGFAGGTDAAPRQLAFDLPGR